MAVTREQALALLQKYNQESFHIHHGLTVEGVLSWYARELGYGDEAEFWGLCGLLHDVDFEGWPEEHCRKAPELLAEICAPEEMIHAICSHAYGMSSDVEPVHQMEKVLFAVDELTGLIGAAARMRPSRSVMDMELSSLKKKFKDKKFAAGCSRHPGGGEKAQNVRVNTIKIIFRAESPEVKLLFDTCKASSGEEIVINNINVTPYFYQKEKVL